MKCLINDTLRFKQSNRELTRHRDTHFHYYKFELRYLLNYSELAFLDKSFFIIMLFNKTVVMLSYFLVPVFSKSCRRSLLTMIQQYLQVCFVLRTICVCRADVLLHSQSNPRMSCPSAIVRTCWQTAFLHNFQIIITYICAKKI